MCDLCVASDNARFMYPEATMGFAGGMIASIASRIPHKIAMELMLLGEEISADRAYQVGFVNKLVPAGQHLIEAEIMARKLARNAPMVMAMLKHFTDSVLPKSPVEQAGYAWRENEAVFTSHDYAEGLAAFKEKRPPKFTGT
jgi:enoyl-CoA hydratase/carnithine racemase